MLLKRCRIRPKIYNRVENRSRRATYQFRFLVRRSLIVHPTEGALSLIERDVALHESRDQAVRSELSLTKCAGEESSIVLVPLQINEERTL